MRYLPKIAKAILIFVVAVFALLFSAAFIVQEKVAAIIIASLNRNLSTRIETGPVRLSFIRSFPRASAELRNVVVHSSPGLEAADFHMADTDTLLYSESVFMIFRPVDIFKGNYHIESIIAKSGRINLLSDRYGITNFNISSGVRKDTSEFILDLENINLHNIKASYIDKSSGFSIYGLVKDGKLKSRIKGSNIIFNAKSDIETDSIVANSATLRHPFKASVDLDLESSDEGVRFGKSKLIIDDFDFGVEGTISREKLYDLLITGNNIDLKGFMRYLPDKILKKASLYDPSGKVEIRCTLKGLMTKNTNPHIELECSLAEGNIRYSGSDLAIRNISFKGQYTNGAANASRTASASFKELKLRLGSSEYSGSIHTRNFTTPVTEIVLKGKLNPSEIKEFFDLTSISVARGSVDADLRITTAHKLSDSITVDDFIDMRSEGALSFNSFTLGIAGKGIIVGNVNGNLAVSDIYHTDGLEFEYSGQKIRVKGEFKNLPAWFRGRNVTLYAAGDVYLSRFVPENFASKDKGDLNKGVEFPSDMVLDINFKIDSLRYKTLASSGIKGSLTYKPKLLTFKSLDLKALDGSISGNGFIIQNTNKSFISRGDFNISGIDVKKTFKTFNNFGQNFIVEENLSGDLSGSVSILLPLTPDWKPRTKELTAEGKYVLTEGTLTNFEPVKKLSSFVELSELENISFEKLENDFYIRNNTLVIPQMDVKSSAADITVNGRHSFENNYEYHVRVLLSQILSKKRRAARRVNTEFGAVKDDGLGRTSLLLKVENKGEDVKVSYDIKAVGHEINKNLQTEKQVLKTILNEEYGSRNNEGTMPVPATPDQKKTRFNITWEETDTIPVQPEKEEEKGFRSLFRKK